MHVYEVIKRPVLTEKTMDMMDFDNQYVFEVDMRANKIQVKDAVETIFDVSVDSINVMVMPAKTRRRWRRVMTRKPKWKKAVATLVAGDRIQLFDGV